jgi:DNA topoisomerase-1
LTVERAEELLAAPSGDRTLGTDPESGLPILVRSGRFGPYVQLGETTEGGERPRTASLFRTMSPETLTLSQALDLLQLPRLVGTDPSSGQEIHALNGRFGPYLKKGSETRSLDDEGQLLIVTLEDALARFAQPKARRGRTPAAPLRELGDDPESGQPIVVRSGRYGPYVTDGATNASLRKGDDPETITLERAAELLSDRRAAGPPVKRASRARTSTKSAKKATKAAKKTTKAAKKTTEAAKKATKAAKGPRATQATDPSPSSEHASKPASGDTPRAGAGLSGPGTTPSGNGHPTGVQPDGASRRRDNGSSGDAPPGPSETP